MEYPSQEDALTSEPVLDWIDDHFLRTDPFAFKDVPGGFRRTASLISRELDVDRNGIFCIGSGAIGLSLNPGKAKSSDLKLFDAESDIDLAVISEVHFETAWRDLRRAVQPTVEFKYSELQDKVKWQRKRFFDGAILATELMPAFSFGADWATALVRIEEHISISLDRDIKMGLWIYRDYWSLRNYVSDGLVRCRKGVAQNG